MFFFCILYFNFLFISTEVSFDERIALELDALDHLDIVESPVAEQPMIIFQKLKDEHNVSPSNEDHKNISEQHFEENSIESDEVRIMIKVLGPKVSVHNCVIIKSLVTFFFNVGGRMVMILSTFCIYNLKFY